MRGDIIPRGRRRVTGGYSRFARSKITAVRRFTAKIYARAAARLCLIGGAEYDNKNKGVVIIINHVDYGCIMGVKTTLAVMARRKQA